jgi:hypothetical protein
MAPAATLAGAFFFWGSSNPSLGTGQGLFKNREPRRACVAFRRSKGGKPFCPIVRAPPNECFAPVLPQATPEHFLVPRACGKVARMIEDSSP